MAFKRPNIYLFWLMCIAVVLSSRHCLSKTLVQLDQKNSSPNIAVWGEVTAENENVSGAFVYVIGNELLSEAVTDEDGKFHMQLDTDEPAKILIVAKGKPAQIHSIDPKQKSKIEIELANEIASFEGRIIDNQGMNVENAELRVVSLVHQNSTIEIPMGLDNPALKALTNQNGVFQVNGVGRPMVGTVEISGRGIVTSTIGRESFDDEVVLVAQPARAVRGKVFDRITKKPISGALINLSTGLAQDYTDGTGAFEIRGIPAFQPLILFANPSGENPFIAGAKRVPVEFGFDQIEVEVDLEPGVWVKCRVNDFSSDGPATAEIFYFPTPENNNFRSFIETIQARRAATSSSTDSAGEAKIVAATGPGVIAIVAPGFPPDDSINKLTDEQRGMLLTVTGRNDLTAVKWIEPKDLEDELELSFLVSRGREIDVELVGNQINSTEPMVIHRAASKNTYDQFIRGPKFVAEQFHPGETRQILIHAKQKRLGAVLNVKAEHSSPVPVTLEPTGSILGQVVDKTGDPQAGLLIQFEVPANEGYQKVATSVFTDVNGRFDKPSLIAGLKYRVAVIRLTGNQQMMAGAPAMDSRWYVAENLEINSEEAVDLGAIVLGAPEQPNPKRSKRTLRKETPVTSNVLPTDFSGIIKNVAGESVTGASISFNTWSSQSGNLKEDLNLAPVVLAQSRSDSNGNFQMTIDPSLANKVVESDVGNGGLNAAIVVVAEKLGAFQIPIQEISDPKNIEIQMIREMIVRGTVKSPGNAEDQKTMLMMTSPMRVYDTESVKQIVEQLHEGVSLEQINAKFHPKLTLDPLAGGIPLAWEATSSRPFLVRNIPLNSIFEITAIDGSDRQEAITIISRPIRSFDFQINDDSAQTRRMQGSRIRLDLGR